MMGPRKRPHKPHRDEAEKPFWISFSDLMTALMVLFLVAMAVALMSLTQGLRQTEEVRSVRESAVSACLNEVRQLTEQSAFSGMRLVGQTLELGRLAEFGKDSNRLSSQSEAFCASGCRKFCNWPAHRIAKTGSSALCWRATPAQRVLICTT